MMKLNFYNEFYERHIMLFKRKIAAISIFFLPLILIAGCGGGGGGSSSGGGSVAGSGITTKSITLSWASPETNDDGSPIDDLAGFKVFYGKGSKNYMNSVDVGSLNEATINNLTTGTWCFSTTAYDFSGNESSPSNEVCTEII